MVKQDLQALSAPAPADSQKLTTVSVCRSCPRWIKQVFAFIEGRYHVYIVVMLVPTPILLKLQDPGHLVGHPGST